MQIGYILVYINVIIIALAISIKFDKKIDFTIFISIACISIIEYLIAIVMNLVVANVCVIIFSIVCFIFLIYQVIKNKNLKFIIKKITPGFILITILYIMSIFLYREKMATHHNELGIWALIVKNLNYYDTLPKANWNLLYWGYTPITGLWHYWFSNFFSEFTDGNMYISSALLQYSLAIAITSFINEKNKIRDFLIKLTTIAILYIAYHITFITLLMDPVLGLIVALSILYIVDLKEIKKENIFFLLIILTYLMLSKETGMIFVFVFLIVLLLKWLKCETNKKKVLLIVALLFALTFGSKWLWNVYLGANGINNISGDSSNLNIKSIVEFLTGDALEYKYETFKNYIEYLIVEKDFTLFKEIKEINVSIVGFFLVTIFVMILTYIRKKDKDLLYLIIAVIGANILYLGALMLVYLFVFSQWEAESLSAIGRHVKVLSILNTCALLYTVYEKIEYRTFSLVAFTIIIIFSGKNVMITEITNNKGIIQSTIETRKEYIGIEKYRDIFNENDKIYFVTQHSGYIREAILREYDLLNVKYQITPFKVYMNDTDILTEQEIIDKLNCGYTYVYFHNLNEDNKNRYKFLLKENETIRENDLFKLYEENGKLMMELVNIET